MAVTEILRKCICCHDKHICQNPRKKRESCISDVSVLQIMTLTIVFELVYRCKVQKLEQKRHIIRHNFDNITITLFFEVG